MNKYYTKKEIVEKLQKAGIVCNHIKTLEYWQNTKLRKVVKTKKPKLILRKLPNGRYVATDKDIEGMIKAFRPGGKGYYHAR